MANYPTSAPSFSNKSAGQTIGSAHINSLQDEVAAVGAALIGTLQHDVKVANGKYLFAAGRSVAEGVWQAASYASSNFFTNDGSTWQINAVGNVTYRYMLFGQTAFIHLGVSNSTIAGASTTTTQLRFKLPSGVLPAQSGQPAVRVSDPSVGGPESGELVLSSGSATVIIRRSDVTKAWTNGVTAFTVDFSFETSS